MLYWEKLFHKLIFSTILNEWIIIKFALVEITSVILRSNPLFKGISYKRIPEPQPGRLTSEAKASCRIPDLKAGPLTPGSRAGLW